MNPSEIPKFPFKSLKTTKESIWNPKKEKNLIEFLKNPKNFLKIPKISLKILENDQNLPKNPSKILENHRRIH